MKKEILIVIGSLDVGGTERHLAALLPRLVAAGRSVRIITLVKKGVLAADLEKQGVPVVCMLSDQNTKRLQRLPNPLKRLTRLFLCVSRLALLLRKEKNTIVHFFLPEAYVVGMLATLLAGFPGPRVMSRRSLNYYQHKRPFIGWLEKKLHTKTTYILGNSAAILNQLKEEEQVPAEKLALIYNGIDFSSFVNLTPSEITRKNLNIKPGALVMVIVANLIPYKGHVDLLAALGIIQDKLPPDWQLISVGRDDGIGPSLQEQAKALGLMNHLLWLGSRKDIPDILGCANIGLLVSHEEGFSNAILEGMAASLPMIVTRVGGNPEAVIDNMTGLVVEPKNPSAIANAILTLVNSPQQAAEYGRQGYLRVHNHFSLDASVKAYEQFYERLD